jgi:hypothetical protein
MFNRPVFTDEDSRPTATFQPALVAQLDNTLTVPQQTAPMTGQDMYDMDPHRMDKVKNIGMILSI